MRDPLAYLEPRPRMQKAVNEPVVVHVEKAMAKVAKPPMAHLDLCARLVRVATRRPRDHRLNGNKAAH